MDPREPWSVVGIDRLERTLGVGAALAAARSLLDRMPEGPARSALLIRALDIAATSRPDEFPELLERWRRATKASHRHARSLVRRLLLAEKPHLAHAVADAELRRTAGGWHAASARYLRGRARECEGLRSAALEDYDAASAASSQRPAIARSAAARGVRLRSLLGQHREAAAQARPLLPLTDALPRERLWVAVAALRAPGRYTRCAALDVLSDTLEDLALLKPALVAIECFLQRHGADLSEIEEDRLDAALARIAEPQTRARAVRANALRRGLAHRDTQTLTQLAAHSETQRELLRRTETALGGADPGPPLEGGRGSLTSLALAMLHATQTQAPETAQARAQQAITAIRGGAALEAGMWSAAEALFPLAAEQASELTDALIDGQGDGPPRGYEGLAAHAERAGRPDLTLRLLERAMEVGASEAVLQPLADRLRYAGWRAAQSDDLDGALRQLRTARTLYQRLDAVETSARPTREDEVDQ